MGPVTEPVTVSRAASMASPGKRSAGFDLEKIPAASVATSALDALEADEPEAPADDYSRAIKAGLSDDQDGLYPQIEHQFLEMIGAETTAT